MTWTLSSSLDEFRDEAGAFLAAHPAENTVLLTLVDRLAKDGPHVFGDHDPAFGWWRPGPGAPVEGVYVQTLPYPPRLGRMPAEAGAELAGALHAAGREVPGVGGGKEAAVAFAAAWRELTGATAAVDLDQRLYRLDVLRPPHPVPSGHARPGRPEDREQLIAWCRAFMVEVGEPETGVTGLVDRRLADGGWHVWEDGGRPVSLAGVSPVIAGMARIGPVYTPPEERGRGYAGGVVAARSAATLALGAEEVLLYTDLANPTSNSVYQKLGYRPVTDCVVIGLH
ncbi:GNAT family N-acetyltransferase [Kitasatospora camelliae]|uniref:GNAT family N-acetyltransferase n=1 Tax=Kitasatospora camelliae TaxID=3156397 RepID=A0AAU8K1I5_9ACTN